MADRKKVIEQLESMRDYHRSAGNNITADIASDALELLKEQPEIVRCKDCKWYDERISMCDNCGLPREQPFFCADGKRR